MGRRGPIYMSSRRPLKQHSAEVDLSHLRYLLALPSSWLRLGRTFCNYDLVLRNVVGLRLLLSVHCN